ncbi:hypothetical protein NE237_007919 [Protea cynaroides]|uniref:GRAM domain-containing protein n=1 Tax=Protea cynaroides TaxID=273540 RepID=A0A9Q0QWX4_9MAGN|nr:hypothetical protein NE237_007919 [Protea cynaroides]
MEPYRQNKENKKMEEGIFGGASGGGSSMPQPSNPYIQTSSVPGSSGNGPMLRKACSRLGRKFEDCARKAEGLTENCWHHLKTSPSLTDAAMARLAQGTKVFAEGGHEKVFQQTFQTSPEEKLLKSFACYLSTSSGPVIGMLYVSTLRVAFCSDNPLRSYPAPGQQELLYYKVSVQLHQLVAVNPSSNRLNPNEKYIELVTSDGHEFWFMGFVSYDKALKILTEVLQYHGAFSHGNLQSEHMSRWHRCRGGIDVEVAFMESERLAFEPLHVVDVLEEEVVVEVAKLWAAQESIKDSGPSGSLSKEKWKKRSLPVEMCEMR